MEKKKCIYIYIYLYFLVAGNKIKKKGKTKKTKIFFGAELNWATAQ